MVLKNLVLAAFQSLALCLSQTIEAVAQQHARLVEHALLVLAASIAKAALLGGSCSVCSYPSNKQAVI